MKLTPPANDNYSAVVIAVGTILDVPNSDYLAAIPVFGHQIIARKDIYQPGHLALFFPAETQLEGDYARQNNLYRHAELNADPSATGYLEDSRRVKAIKLRGNRSDAMLMPLTSLAYTGINPDDLAVGDTFDTINGVPICRKYVTEAALKAAQRAQAASGRSTRFTRIDGKHLPEHISTDNYFRNSFHIDDNTDVVVTAKLHGTSVRIGNTIVRKPLTWRDRLAKRMGIAVQETGFDNVYGSRRVIKDANDPNGTGYYDTDVWSNAGRKLDGIIPENWIVFGELVGWTAPGSPIQKGYSYGIADGVAELYVYRIAIVNARGRTADLSWDAVKQFCVEAGINHVPELWRGQHRDLDIALYMDRRFYETGFTQTLPLEAGSKKNPIVDEGVCVRVEGLTPRIYKAKSPVFFQFETKQLDADVADIETVGAAA